ncbi:hypothetical protein OAE97_02105 [Verrucomicrobia bacterium]|jgi:Tfp pilus assembly protein PilO|nr:hypothetical protein [Verrucomicrobiota bacterium]MDG1891447.1 hypothetical protein [Verrucomicrobiota bacterium]
MNKVSREKKLLIVAVSAVVILFGDKFLVSPMLGAWENRSNQILELEKKLVRGRALMKRESNIRRQWMSMWQGGMPLNKSVSENKVLESVDRWASESRISFTSIKPNWRVSEQGHLTLECRANGYGNLDKITRFVHALESDPMALRVDSLELTQRNEEGSVIGMNINFSGLLLTEALK